MKKKNHKNKKNYKFCHFVFYKDKHMCTTTSTKKNDLFKMKHLKTFAYTL